MFNKLETHRTSNPDFIFPNNEWAGTYKILKGIHGRKYDHNGS